MSSRRIYLYILEQVRYPIFRFRFDRVVGYFMDPTSTGASEDTISYSQLPILQNSTWIYAAEY
jgi:hypothetical protein